MKKRILFSLVIFMLIFTVGAVIKTSAGTGESGSGWSWGGTEDDTIGGLIGSIDGNETGAGWISMNSLNCDSDENGITDIGNYPNCPVGLAVSSYGVNIPAGDGNVTGMAWSSNLGWIDFDSSLCNSQYVAISCVPPSGSAGVVRSGNNLNGWVRIVSIAEATVSGNSGGWEGWISMSGTAQDSSPYGVTISGNSLSGYAWSDELGWVDFSRASITTTDILKICSDNCDNGGGTPLTGNVSFTESETRDLRACYNSSSVCDDATGDVTSDPGTAWAETPNPDDAVSLSGGNPNVLTATAAGSEDVSVTYSSGNTSFTANVTGICSYNLCDESTSYQCSVRSGTDPCPTDNCSDTGTPETCYPPDYNWREVSP